jgi:2-polyprenyl-3-methyl-5-hydroxy-6-metoxy-1,4-benzoquinol methylase
MKFWHSETAAKNRRRIGNIIKRVLPGKLQFARHQRCIKKMSEAYDMCEGLDEQYFKRVYLKYILGRLGQFSKEEKTKLKILDAGCGSGRIAIALAKLGYKIDAVDCFHEVINKGLKYAEEEGVEVNYLAKDLSEYLRERKENTYDCVICTEVVLMLKDYNSAIAKLVRVLKPGGILFLSVRTRLYSVLYQLINKNMDQAVFASANMDGNSINWFTNWFTSEELTNKLNSLGIKDLKCYGIGVVSGIENDPQALFVRPSALNKKELENLYEIEMNLGPLYPDSGRYILAIGQKGAVK